MYDGKTCSIFMKNGVQSSKAGWIITYRKYSRLEGEPVYCVECEWNGKNPSCKIRRKYAYELAGNIHRDRVSDLYHNGTGQRCNPDYGIVDRNNCHVCDCFLCNAVCVSGSREIYAAG